MSIPLIASKLSIDLTTLKGVSAAADDLTPVWVDEVQPYVTDFLTKRFATAGAYLGTAWAPLAPVTQELRKRPGHGRGGIGRDVGRLWASLVKSAGTSAAPGGLLAIGPHRYERGSALPHAAPFAGGFNSTRVPVRSGKGWVFVRRRTPKHVQARPIFPNPLPPTLVTFVADAVARHVSRGVQ